MNTPRTLQEAYEQVGSVPATSTSSAPPAQNTTQSTDALDEVLNKLFAMDARTLAPIIDNLYGQKSSEQILQNFLRQKSQKYTQYSPQQRQQYAERFQQALGNAYNF